jgi:hypothetical protein
MKINLEVEDMKFKDTKEVYYYIIDILETAVGYDTDQHDILATIEEVEKYLEPLKEVITNSSVFLVERVGEVPIYFLEEHEVYSALGSNFNTLEGAKKHIMRAKYFKNI